MAFCGDVDGGILLEVHILDNFRQGSPASGLAKRLGFRASKTCGKRPTQSPEEINIYTHLNLGIASIFPVHVSFPDAVICSPTPHGLSQISHKSQLPPLGGRCSNRPRTRKMNLEPRRKTWLGDI